MAKNTKQGSKGLDGLPPVDALLSPENFDTVPAVVRSSDGAKDQPAALTEGEFVISVPAIIALGEGDYELGAQRIEDFHNALREESKKYLTKKGLEAAGIS